jgi:hypothetical protein
MSSVLEITKSPVVSSLVASTRYPPYEQSIVTNASLDVELMVSIYFIMRDEMANVPESKTKWR